MRCYRSHRSDGYRLVTVIDETAYDLTETTDSPRGISDAARTAAAEGRTLESYLRRLAGDAPIARDFTGVEDAALPVVPEEVWAAGVTYEISEAAREAESGLPEVYLDVYEADRPELFFKATPGRLVGPNDAVGIRGDSSWDVPEPELGIVLHRGEIVGYTIGNDMSSRSIEGDNPLYLPQAKVYDRSCSIGPCVVPASVRDDWDDLEIRMTIERDGETMYDDRTSTSEMVRSHDELVSYLARHNAIPETTVLLTGTSLVPDDDFTLEAGDRVAIEIDGIGRLENTVTVV
ncbi:fumarylacetoacetate hydrolase family protein [Halosolutus halophilus]|uniref:fumarylacetoacetate hydrolase family protein n=1 Tax=Halosolutus halophilus TaxID=1552990 RepID=UPI00223509CD|nr:fumarylacetoacetate hydrolase family protein [Halosolutus halophilus]